MGISHLRKRIAEKGDVYKRQENKLTEKVPLPAVGTVHVKAPTFDGSSHWAMYLRQFEAAGCANNWTEKDKAHSRSRIKGTRGRTTTESAT